MGLLMVQGVVQPLMARGGGRLANHGPDRVVGPLLWPWRGRKATHGPYGGPVGPNPVSNCLSETVSSIQLIALNSFK